MPLTPLDVDNMHFRGAFRGYNRDDVEQFMAEVVKTLEQNHSDITALKSQIAQIERELDHYRDNEKLLKDSVLLAQKTADELIAAAHQRADIIRREAHLEGEEIRRELADLKTEREQFEYAFHGLLAGFLNRLEMKNPGLTGRHVQGQELHAPRYEPEPDNNPFKADDPLPQHSVDATIPDEPVERDEPDPTVSIPPEGQRIEASAVEQEVPYVAERQPEPAPRAEQPQALRVPSAEVDRDGDIADFSQALNVKPEPRPAPAPPAVEEPEDQGIPASLDDIFGTHGAGDPGDSDATPG